MSFGLLGGGAAARCEFVRMKGPSGKGHAEMAVSRPRGSGLDTPASEPATDLWDSDWEQDPEEMFMCRHQRRLSDPSANLNHFVRGGWRSKDGRDKSRSENEGLDSLVNGIAEVEAGDLRDARRGSASSGAWCCVRARTHVHAHTHARTHARAPLTADMRHVYARAAPRDTSSPACLRTRAPQAAPMREAPGPPPLRPLPAPAPHTRRAPLADPEDCEEAEDAGELDDCDILRDDKRRFVTQPTSRVTVRGCEETPGEDANGNRAESAVRARGGGVEPTEGEGEGEARACRSPNRGARAYCTLPRRRAGVGAALYRDAALPPTRTTPDGTDIYYWCDLPNKKYNELDDGAYNPLWAMRGFTQTFHLWKEGKRAQSAPLNAYLTYVTLPWWSIAKDILDHREEPILTF